MKTRVEHTEMFDVEPGVIGVAFSRLSLPINIDFDGKMWDQKRLAVLDFADDISAVSHTLARIQEITNSIERFGANVGLSINSEKTNATTIGPEQDHPIPSMQQNVDYVVKFPYFGNNKSSNGDSDRTYAPGSEKLHRFSNSSILYGHQLPST